MLFWTEYSDRTNSSVLSLTESIELLYILTRWTGNTFQPNKTLQITVPVVSDPTKFLPDGSKVHPSSTNRPKIGPNDRKQPVQPSLIIKSQSFSTLNVSPPGTTYKKSPPLFFVSSVAFVHQLHLPH